MAKLRTVFVLFFWFNGVFLEAVSALNTASNISLNDTITLATTKKGFALKKGIQQVVIPLSVEIPINIQRYNYSLLLDSVQVDSLSEGIYEVFISAQPPDKRHLSSKDARFIGLLDLYSLSNKANNKRLSIPIVEKIRDTLDGKKKGDCVYLIIQFSGNVLPNGKMMPHVSHLSCSLARLIQF